MEYTHKIRQNLGKQKKILKKIDSVLVKYLNYSNVIVVAHAEIFASIVRIDEILHCSILEYTQF